MSGVLGGNLNFVGHEKEMLLPAGENVTKRLASEECD